MSQAMNFSPLIKQLSGGELPPNSINLVYSPSCPHCHNIMPQYNQLPGLSGGKFSVNAVNLMDHYHELRAGGVEVGGVPQILIRGGSTELMEYNGPRMAESIAKEAFSFIDGQLAGGSIPAAPKAMESTDALLGGATELTPAAPDVELTGGKKHHKRRRSKSKSHRRHHMRGGSYRRHYMRGGSTLTGGDDSAEITLEGGRRRSRSRSRSRRSRRSRSRSRSRSRRHHMRGGSIEAGETPSVPEAPPAEVSLEGGRARKRGHQLDRWRMHLKSYMAKHPKMLLRDAMMNASKSYRG